MKTQFKKNMIVLAILGCSVGPIQLANANVSSASIRGHVATVENVTKSGIKVTAINVGTGSKLNVMTNEKGDYTLTGLKPGNYRLQVGDSALQTDVFTVSVGQSRTIDLQNNTVSKPSDNTEVIQVVGSALAFDVTSEVGTTVSANQIAGLPQINRNFLSFADLAPGVNVNVDAEGNVKVNSGAQGASAINVFIDGVGQKDYVLHGGISGQDSSRGNPFPQAAIGEYKIISSNYKAEFDQVSSAAIVAVTKSGTNEFHGGVFYDFTNDTMREKTPLEKGFEDREPQEKADTKQEQYGFWASGPIITDQLHFLVSYERKQNQDGRDIIVNNRRDLIDNYPQFLQDAIAQNEGPTTVDFEEDLFFGKLDWNINDQHHLAATIKYRDEVEVTGVGGINTQQYGTDKDSNDLRLSLSHQYWGNDWSNDLTFTYEDVEWSPHARTNQNGAIYQVGIADRIEGDVIHLGGGPDFQEKGQKGWAIKNDTTFTDLLWHGEHTVKVGFNYKSIELSAIESNPFNPQTYYVVDATDISQDDSVTVIEPIPYKMDYAGGGTNAAVSENEQIGIYIQDDWRITDRLELNLGIRASYEDTPIFTDYVTPTEIVDALSDWPNIADTDYDIDDYISTGNNRDNPDIAFAPRVGFSYMLTDDAAQMIYGGYGRSYGRNNYDYLQLETTKGTFPRQTVNFSGDHNQFCAEPCVPFEQKYLLPGGTEELMQAGGSREVFLTKNDFKQPYTDQYSLGLRSIFDSFDSEIGFTRVEARDGLLFQLGNRRANGEFFDQGATWGAPWGEQIPANNLSNLILANNGLESDRDSVHLKLNKPHVKSNWGGTFVYTYSDATEKSPGSEVFSFDYPHIDQWGIGKALGVSDHVIVATVSYDLPWEIKLSSKLTLKSAAPFSGVNCTEGWTDCFIDRGYQDESTFLVAKWAYQQIDLSLSKDFVVSDNSAMYVRLDVLNLLNEENYGVSDTWFGAPNEPNANVGSHFGALVGPTRTIKLSVGYNF